MTTDRETTVVARTVTRIAAPVILVTAVALLLQGHNLPGGGFIAGVLTAAAAALVYIIYGIDYLEAELLGYRPSVPYDEEGGAAAEYGDLFGAGLALAVGSGIVAILLGHPFLSQGVWFLKHLPVFGELEVASALAFDVGVYVVVVGSLLTILTVVGAE